MRIVQGPDEFIEAFLGAQREAAASFGINTILLEKYITHPRHVEVQVKFDQNLPCVIICLCTSLTNHLLPSAIVSYFLFLFSPIYSQRLDPTYEMLFLYMHICVWIEPHIHTYPCARTHTHCVLYVFLFFFCLCQSNIS